MNKKDTKIISFMNMKGGVGKTTLCLSLGYHLSKFKNKSILFIDLDPQFNLTQSLLSEYDLIDEYLQGDYKENSNNICTIFSDKEAKIGEKPVSCSSEDVIRELEPNLDIVYGSLYLIRILNSEPNKYKLKYFIDDNNLRGKYDYIFIDCPPTISLYTSAALHTSDYYIIPNKIDRYSILGIKLLDDAIKQEGVSSNRKINIEPLGIIYTVAPTDLNDRVKKIMVEFESNSIVNKMGLFIEPFYEVKHLSEAKQGNIASKYKSSKENIEVLSEEFIERIEERVKKSEEK